MQIMDKRKAAEKLIEIFGDWDIVSMLHSVLVESSKYLIIILFAVYTWRCFTVFAGKDADRKERIYRGQSAILFCIHFICSLVLFLNSLNVLILLLYAAQIVFLVFLGKAYPYVYHGMSKMLLINMQMLLVIGFIVLERLNTAYCIRQMIFAAVISFAGLFIPWLIEKFSYFDRFGWFYAIGGICLLALVFVIGEEHGGSKNWISIAGFAMQPSEFVKIVFVFFLAAFLARSTRFYDVVRVTIVAGIHVIILVFEKDLGAALIFYITYLFMLYVSSRNAIYLGAGVLAGVAASVIAYKLFNHVRVRVFAWSNPWSDPADAGYQITQSLFAIGTGGWFGMGLGEGMPKKIPVAESDFIFSAICEELGVFFGLCLILVEVSCFLLFINISLKMTRRFYKLVAFGLSIEYIFQVFLTLGGVTKFIPSTGVTLPLVSYGGSSIISTVILFAIIQGMYVLNCGEEAVGINGRK